MFVERTKKHANYIWGEKIIFFFFNLLYFFYYRLKNKKNYIEIKSNISTCNSDVANGEGEGSSLFP